MSRDTAKSARVLISLPDKFLSEIDDLAESEHRSRSELIREALRNYIRAIDDVEQTRTAAILEE